MIESADEQLVIDYSTCENTLKFLEKELESIENSNIKIKKPHLNFIHSKIDQVLKEMKQIKARMKKREVKIIEVTKKRVTVEYRFMCRGYEGAHEPLRTMVKKKVLEKLNDLYK